MLGDAEWWSLVVSWRGRQDDCELCGEMAIERHPGVLLELYCRFERGA